LPLVQFCQDQQAPYCPARVERRGRKKQGIYEGSLGPCPHLRRET
jgi:hypothetical protein